MAQAGSAAPAAIPGGGFVGVYSAAVRQICLIATIIAAAALLIELAVVLVSITGRATVGYGPMWSDEASRLALATIAFIGGAAAYRGSHHTAVRFVTDRLPRAGQLDVGAGIEWLVLIVCLVCGVAVCRTSARQLGQCHADPADQRRLDRLAGDRWSGADRAVAGERLLVDYSPRIALSTRCGHGG